MDSRDDSVAERAQDDDGPSVGLVDLLTWLGEGKRLIATATVAVGALALGYSMLLTPIFTARTTLLPPGSQQQSGSAAALAALGSLGGLAGGLASKSPDELYVALLKSDSVMRALDQRFDLKARYKIKLDDTLRKLLPTRVRVLPDRKSGVIGLEVDDEDAKFAADLANAYPEELTKLLGRLAVSEAQQRRVFYEQQLKETKEHLIKAEQDLQKVQEKSGVIVLDKQAEALIGGAAQIRALIAEREVQLKVLRTAATEQNPDVLRLSSELRALRAELSRMESRRDGEAGSAVDMPVGKIPAASVDYVRARREVKLQETLLEGMVRQYEIAKLDEAKEGATLQQVDKALPPDHKSKPSRALITIVGTLLGLLGACAFVLWRRYAAFVREVDPQGAQSWQVLRRAWHWRR
ncbi:Wzz/FepE/Etk N-terminal domain-containing protein [Piscinibacter sp. XHJ-5]|uniref:GumC family protein n=1 Tax=Piscinibacter sp. XHJ-5 TaxID=3037797 RepID=UPI0024536325|nr:Wzz/FepE/Etk N-terminal domain-containing protein [Piscinibacter sp. XHJ-5]